MSNQDNAGHVTNQAGVQGNLVEWKVNPSCTSEQLLLVNGEDLGCVWPGKRLGCKEDGWRARGAGFFTYEEDAKAAAYSAAKANLQMRAFAEQSSESGKQVESDNHREIEAEFVRLDSVAPHWSKKQKRQSVIDTLCFRWSMTSDEVAEIVDASKKRKVPWSYVVDDQHGAVLVTRSDSATLLFQGDDATEVRAEMEHVTVSDPDFTTTFNKYSEAGAFQPAEAGKLSEDRILVLQVPASFDADNETVFEALEQGADVLGCFPISSFNPNLKQNEERKLVEMEYYVWTADGSCDNKTTDLSEAKKWRDEFIKEGHADSYITDPDGNVIEERDMAESHAVSVVEDQQINEMLASPGVSFWLKNALRSALERDPVDAANDAALLAKVLDERATGMLS